MQIKIRPEKKHSLCVRERKIGEERQRERQRERRDRRERLSVRVSALATSIP